jgi:hypothetical protein
VSLYQVCTVMTTCFTFAEKDRRWFRLYTCVFKAPTGNEANDAWRWICLRSLDRRLIIQSHDLTLLLASTSFESTPFTTNHHVPLRDLQGNITGTAITCRSPMQHLNGLDLLIWLPMSSSLPARVTPLSTKPLTPASGSTDDDP